MKMNTELIKFILITCLVELLLINYGCKQKIDADSGNSILIENFEKYNGNEHEEIFSSWSDGFDNDKNGCQIGYNDTPYIESNLVHSGGQSAPISYDLNKNYAEVSIDTDKLPIGKDWARYSSNLFTLWFYGNTENIPALMYVKLNDAKVYYDKKSDNMRKAKWTQWDIELSMFKNNLKNISTLSIGFEKSEEHPNGKGIIIIDDIRLYKNNP